MAGRTERRSGPSSKRGKPNSGARKRHTGGKASTPQDSPVEFTHRGTEPSEKINNPRNFDILVDDVPYFVKAAPFSFNGETRFTVRVNDGPEHIFTWDSQIKGLRAIDDEASILPDPVEEAISERLQSKER